MVLRWGGLLRPCLPGAAGSAMGGRRDPLSLARANAVMNLTNASRPTAEANAIQIEFSASIHLR